MAAQGEFVALLARDAEALCDSLGGQAHGEIGIGIMIDEPGLGEILLPPIGIIDMDSVPPATMTSAPPP